MTIRQIEFAEAMRLAKEGTPVFVIPNPKKPVIKSFNNLTIGEAVSENTNYIYVVFEGV